MSVARFIFTLWKAHLDFDFSLFGEEAVDGVKRYPSDAASSQVDPTPSEPDQVVVDLSAKDATNTAP